LATFTWVGGTSSDWFDATNWSPQGTIPNDSSADVTVNSDTNDANIINGGAITVGSLSVGGTGISAGQVIVGGSPEIGLGGGGSLTAQSIVLTSTDQNGALVGGPNGVVKTANMTVASGVAIGGGGTYDVTTNLVNNGLILADGGRPDLGLGPVVVQGSTISGTGRLEIDSSSTLEINAATSQNVTVAVSPTEVANLLLDSPGTFKGGVNLVNPSSQLNLYLKGQTPTGVSYDLQTGSLIVTGAGGVLETIPLSSPNAITFKVVTSTIAGYGEVSINLDAAAPAVTSVTASPSDAILGAGALVNLALNFGETVLVGTSGGTPTLSLNNGGTATYVSGSGTNALTFRYTVAAGQDTPDLGITAVNLNGATVTDQTGNAANLTGAVGNPPGTLAIEPTAVAGLDTTTGQPLPIVAKAYTGPVAGLQNEYINVTSHNLNIAAATPNWFIHTGSGDDAIAVSSGINVLDGGTGSNFMTGGSGTDTFFVDDRAATADIWSTVNNFHAGDAATIWGVTAQDFGLAWTDGQGAAGFTGLTLHATAAGKPTASLTLTGYTSADLNNGRLSVSFGTDPASGSAYMYVHGNA
jgi:hypothetical protein